MKPTTIRPFLSLSLSNNWSIHQLYVKNYFLHSKLKDIVYKQQPMCFRDPTHPEYYMSLSRPLGHGINVLQIMFPPLFFHTIDMKTLYSSTKKGPLWHFTLCLWHNSYCLSGFSMLLHYGYAWLKICYEGLGPSNYFLGITVTLHKDGVFLSHKKYAEEIIDRAGMSSCKATSNLVDTKSKVSRNSGALYDDRTHNHSLLCALQYLTFTRPNISCVV